MKIGLYFNDMGFSGLDLRYPSKGNNGIGGTQYCFLMLTDALIRYTDFRVYVFHYNDNILPESIQNNIIRKREEILDYVVKEDIDILVFKAEGITDFVKKMEFKGVRAVAWAHNYLFSQELTEYCRNEAIRRVVFVGHEMYDRYIDHPIMEKATFIYNMFDGREFVIRPIPQIPAVTYTGSLIPSKGFHVLADVWKDILKAVPNAQLYIIGNGKLYDRSSELGSYGIAEKKYEERLVPCLSMNGHIMDCVHFLGTMGKEKIDIYEKTTVGVMNPTGKTETFGLSAIEMSACGIPVVTKKTNGLFDTVINGKTGFLIRNKRELRERIVILLKDRNKNIMIGQKGKEYADISFLPEVIVKNWVQMFEDIMRKSEVHRLETSKHYFNNMKWLRIINKRIQKLGIKTHPIVDIETSIRNMIRK